VRIILDIGPNEGPFDMNSDCGWYVKATYRGVSHQSVPTYDEPLGAVVGRCVNILMAKAVEVLDKEKP